MKSTFFHFHLQRICQYIVKISITIRLFVTLSIGTALIIVLIGIFANFQSKLARTPTLSIMGLASNVPSQFFLDMIQMEMPQQIRTEDNLTFSKSNVYNFLFQLITEIKIQKPWSQENYQA